MYRPYKGKLSLYHYHNVFTGAWLYYCRLVLDFILVGCYYKAYRVILACTNDVARRESVNLENMRYYLLQIRDVSSKRRDL